MSKTFKLLLICFLSLSVLSFKNRLRQGPGDNLTPPGANQNNRTAGPLDNQTQSPVGEGNNTQPELPLPQGEQGNQTKKPQIIEGNETQPQPLQPLTPEEIIGNETQPQPEQPLTPEEIIGNETLPLFPEWEFKNISESAGLQPEQAVGGAAALAPLLPIGQNLPSTTVVNVDTPVISVSGEAIGSIPSDLVKIGVILQHEGAKSEEAITQNEKKLRDLITKLKELGVKEENISQLGLLINLQKKLKQSVEDTQSNQTENGLRNETSTGALFAISQLEILLDDFKMAGKVIDLLNTENFEIKYIDYSNYPETLNAGVNLLTKNALADAEERARGAIANSGYELGQLLNLNVVVDRDYQNKGNLKDEGKEGFGLVNPQGVKMIKVTVAVTYSLQPEQAGGALPQPPEDKTALEKRKRKPSAAERERERQRGRNATQPQAIENGNNTAQASAGNATA